MDEKAKDILSRRTFLGRAAAAGIGAAVPLCTSESRGDVEKRSQLGPYRRCGRRRLGRGGPVGGCRRDESRRQCDHSRERRCSRRYDKQVGRCLLIPNNHHLVAKGIVDAKADAMRYMVCGAYPTLYREDQSRYGVGEHNTE